MGSSLLAALIEKWGYLNLPMRGRAVLPSYLIGRRNLSDPAIREHFRAAFLSAANADIKGGLGVSTRRADSSLINYEAVSKKLDILDHKSFSNLAELYTAYRELYAEAVLYKQITSVPGRHIELATDFPAYEGKNIETAFSRHFKNIVFFHMTRNFSEWCEAAASQYMARQRGSLAFRFGSRLSQYKEYLDSIKDLRGSKIDFEDLFMPRLPSTIEMICKALGEAPVSGNFEREQFDLYGRLFDYKSAFTKADYPGKYFSGVSRSVARALYTSSLSRFGKSLAFHPFFVAELFRNRRLRAESD